jgi:tetratricopeptide (TPR) repeat protein
MDYKFELKAMRSLDPYDLEMFTSNPLDQERAVTAYNRALEHFSQGHDDVGRIAIDKIVSDFPLFVEAKLLQALLLADEGRYGQAEKSLRELALLDLDDEQGELVARALETVGPAHRQQLNDRRRAGKKNDLLLPVRAEMVRKSILQRAGSRDNVEFASDREREEIMRRIERGETEEHVEVRSVRSGVKSPLVPLLLVAVLLIGLVAAAYFMFIAPAMNKSKNNERKLFWLEQQLVAQQQDPEIAALKQAYEQFAGTLR